jgi:hypothetical protein
MPDRSTRPGQTVAIVSALICGLVLTSCAGGGRFAPVLSRGAEEAAAAFAPVGDDLLDAVRLGTIKVPSSLRQALDDVPVSGLDPQEEALRSTVRNWDSTLSFWNQAVEWATGWDSGVTSEAASLAAASLYIDNASPAFQQQLDELAARLLRSATCKAVRLTLDSASVAAADDAGLAYEDDLPSDETGMEAFLRGVLEQDWDARSLQASVDLAGLASKTIAKANGWAAGLTDIYESPNGTLREANIFYFRACVLKG